MKIVECPPLRAFVERALREGRSPESIAGRIAAREKHLPSVSADSIERFLRSVHGRKIEVCRRKLKKRKRGRKRHVPHALSERRFIEERPTKADRRSRVGDAEADFIVSGKGGKGNLLVVVDRKLRTAFIETVLPVSVENVHKAFGRIRKRYPEMITLTTDNDILLVRHKELERELRVKIYFCHPYHSWEKGTVENANGEIRKDIPKGSDLSKYSKRFVRSVEARLNDRYMDVINHATPKEMLEEHRKRKRRRGGACSD